MRSTTHPAIGTATMVLSAVVVCLAGYWEFEQVDSGSIGSYVAIDKMSDGTTWLAYVNRDSAIRLAHKDTAWEYEDLDTALVRPDPGSWPSSWPPFSFDIGPGDVVGVVGPGRLAERRDSGWSSEAIPSMFAGDIILGYDSACRPAVTFRDSSWNGCFGQKVDSTWDTAVLCTPLASMWGFSLSRPSWRRDGNCVLIEADGWSMGGLIDGYDINVYKRDSGVWTLFWGRAGLDGIGCGFAALADGEDSIHTLWSASDPYGSNELVGDGERMDTYTSIGAACMDDNGRMLCAWAMPGRLKFAIPGWSPRVVLDTGRNCEWCDITTDALSEPVIAFCRGDGIIWVARGVGIVGLNDESRRPAAFLPQSGASIVRGVLVLGGLGTRSGLSDNPVMSRALLLDVSGRKVLDLMPGANDISRVSPGVYFVREEPQASGLKPHAIRKVIIAE